jgi:hypothetical protein
MTTGQPAGGDLDALVAAHELLDELLPLFPEARDGEAPDPPPRVYDVHEAEVGEAGHGEAGDLFQGALVVQGGGEPASGFLQQGEPVAGLIPLLPGPSAVAQILDRAHPLSGAAVFRQNRHPAREDEPVLGLSRVPQAALDRDRPALRDACRKLRERCLAVVRVQETAVVREPAPSRVLLHDSLPARRLDDRAVAHDDPHARR